jgi:hypothetical protein
MSDVRALIEELALFGSIVHGKLCTNTIKKKNNLL